MKEARHDKWTFEPSDRDLDGSDELGFPLSDHVEIADVTSQPLRFALRTGHDVAWVRGRLPVIFGVEPDPSDLENTLLDVCMVAKTSGSERVAFRIRDYCGMTCLAFSFHEDLAVRTAVAEALWSLLLSEPDKLSDYQETIKQQDHQECIDRTVTYRVHRGRLYVDVETEDGYEEHAEDEPSDDD